MLWARSSTQRWISAATALAVVATAIGAVGAPIGVNAERPKGATIATTTTLTSSPNQSQFTQSVTFTATVTATTGGTPLTVGVVNFVIDGSSFTAVPVVSGQASLTTANLSVGVHSVTADFGAAPGFAPSADSFEQTVSKAATQTTVTSSLNPSPRGQQVTFTITVTTPVSGSAVPGDAVLTIGLLRNTFGFTDVSQGSFTTGSLAQGFHTIAGAYLGNDSFLPSSSTPFTQFVLPVPTQTTLTSSTNPSAVGVPVRFTATVNTNGLTPAGDVTFVDGPTVLGTVPVDAGGQATLTTNTLAAGSHTINVSFNGTPAFQLSRATLTQQVNEQTTTTSTTTTTSSTTTTTWPETTTPSSPTPATAPSSPTSTSTTTSSTAPGLVETATELSSSANPSTLGQPVTFTAIVTTVSGSGFAPVGLRSAARPRQVDDDGTMTISDGDTVLAVVPVEAGQAAFTTSSLTAGAHTITAAFSGASTAAPSSITLVQQVNQAPTLPATR